MKPATFEYVAPRRTEDTVQLLAQQVGKPRVLAGGQSLLPLLNLRLARPSLLVDVKGIEEGHELAVRAAVVRIGFAVTQARALEALEVRQQVPLLAHALAYVGNRETRNRGTIVGSIAHSDPAAELPSVMVALGARYELASAEGVRSIEADAFHVGPYTTALAEGEMVTAVEIPVTTGAYQWGFGELSRAPSRFAA